MGNAVVVHHNNMQPVQEDWMVFRHYQSEQDPYLL